MTTLKAVDISSYTGRVVGVEEWAEVKALGYDLAIIQAWTGRSKNVYCHDSLRNAREAGLMTAAYIALLPDKGGGDQAKEGVAAIGDELFHLRFIAIDMEVPGVKEEFAGNAAFYAARYRRTIIYTAFHFWYSQMGNTDAFSDRPLWQAKYDDDDLNNVFQFGGWTSSVGKQYAQNVEVAGINTDLNVFDRDFVEGGNMPDKPLSMLDLLTLIWADLDAIQHSPDVPKNIIDLAEDAKQAGIQKLKELMGIG